MVRIFGRCSNMWLSSSGLYSGLTWKSANILRFDNLSEFGIIRGLPFSDFKTDWSWDTFYTVKTKPANFCITKVILISHISYIFALLYINTTLNRYTNHLHGSTNLTVVNGMQVQIWWTLRRVRLLHRLQMEGTWGNEDYLYVKLITFSLHLNIQVPGYYP